ncbi:MAG TPA: cytochrome ubiquinol oxidase subunit I [Actinomycetota bacterium]|nr:cytochrome ubiquinol oxidase subunit I [Actinomycetota bacterium]
MNPEFLSRLQFGLTISFHFIFPPISMGLGLMMCYMAWKYVRTRDLAWREASFFWVKVYGLVFALGIATGIVQEFQFGTNWSQYSRFVGNVFGSLLAAEGIFAFFLEGGFLGLLLFGGTRLGPKMWFTATALVTFGAHFSAVWILMANSWMQTPQGYSTTTTQWGSQAVMDSFSAVMFTPSFLPRLAHVWVASWMIGSALVLSVSAWYLLKGRHRDFARRNFTVAVRFFAILAILQVFVFGAQMAIEVTNNQQAKLVAMEGSWVPRTCAPFYLVGWVNESAQTTKGISIPCLLSILSYQDPQAVVPGLTQFPEDTWAPVNLTFQVYHLMVDLGFLFPIMGVGIWMYWHRRRRDGRPMPKAVLWAAISTVFLAELATTMGWWTAEIGRQPWMVWNVLRTTDGVSPNLTTGQVLASLIMFALLYALLLVLFLFLLDRKIKHGPTPLDETQSVTSDLPDTLREVFARSRATASKEGP